ncbi:MAG TPA: hypothetical protein PL037_08565, partial [Elusimicrobiales bacterium]|nr:hypothetical protein [Elusimicrobiales bacterium]
LKYAPGSVRVLEVLRALTEKAGKSGFTEGADREMAILRGVLRESPLNWPFYAAAIDQLSIRGDLYAMNELAAGLESAGASEGAQMYEISMGLALCYASMAPWIESQGYLSLNKAPETLVEKAREYVRVRKRAEEMRAYLVKSDSVDDTRRRLVPDALRVPAEVALADMDSGREEAERIYASVSRMDSDPSFLKAVELTVRGNGALMKKDYSGARAFYRSAIQNRPDFLDARKQLVEVDFQEGAALALTGRGLKAGKRSLYDAYSGSADVIKAAGELRNWMPFVTREKFLADAYSIRAAAIAALKAVNGIRPRDQARLAGEFKAALDEAVRLNPQSKLARDLLERYSKEGF